MAVAKFAVFSCFCEISRKESGGFGGRDVT